MRKKILCGAAAMLCAALLAACNQTSAASVASAPISSAPVSSAGMPATAAKIIGTQADGVEPIALENKTGKEITGFSVKSSEETAYPDNMLPQGETFAAGEKRDLYYAISDGMEIGNAQPVPMPAESGNAVSSAAESRDPNASSTASAKALPPQYDVQLTFADKSTAVLHAFPFGDTAQGSICQEDGVTFLTYLSTSSKEEVSTKDAEQKLLTDAQASSTPESSEAAVSSSAPASKATEESEETTASQQAQEADAEPASKPKTSSKPKTTTTEKPKSTPKASSKPKTSSKATTPDTNQGTTQTPDTNGGDDSGDGCLNGGLLW